jgi:hypothetical protein
MHHISGRQAGPLSQILKSQCPTISPI